MNGRMKVTLKNEDAMPHFKRRNSADYAVAEDT
jgi:hypothetical protein